MVHSQAQHHVPAPRDHHTGQRDPTAAAKVDAVCQVRVAGTNAYATQSASKVVS